MSQGTAGARLVFESGPTAGREIDLAGTVSLGSSEGCDVVLGSETGVVSPHHASIEVREGRYVLVDERSIAGTFVNRRRIEEQELTDGDLIEFGLGGPAARLTVGARAEVAPPPSTAADEGTVGRLAAEARENVGEHATSGTMMREFMQLAYARAGRKATRPIFWILLLAVAIVGGTWAVATQRLNRANEQIDGLGEALLREREYRGALFNELSEVRGRFTALVARYSDLEGEVAGLEGELGDLEVRYQGLRSQHGDLRVRYETFVEAQEAQRRAVEEDARFGEALMAGSAPGVGMLTFVWGFREREGGEIVRARRGPDGRPEWFVSEGDSVPEVFLGGDGPPVGGGGGLTTAALIHPDGWVVAGGTVAEPWREQDLSALGDVGALGLEPVLLDVDVRFPPGGKAVRLRVAAVSSDGSLTLLRSLDGPIDAPAVRLAAPDAVLEEGDAVVAMGYPDGLANVLDRLEPTERVALVSEVAGGRSGDYAVAPFLLEPDLGAELGERELLVPGLALGAAVDGGSETGTVVFETDPGAGFPSGVVFGAERNVVALDSRPLVERSDSASMRWSAIPVARLWEIVPVELRDRLLAVDPATPPVADSTPSESAR